MASSSNVGEIDERPIDPNEFADEEVNYSAPAQKSIQEIISSDPGDDSLRKYKETLLGAVNTVVIDPNNPLNVLMKKLSLVSDGRVIRSIDLPANEDYTLTIKEGAVYKIRFEFNVQREIASGLRYLHRVRSRLGIPAHHSHMLGSFGPSRELYVCETPPEEAPTGMLARGKYRVRSLITDDDKNRYLEWNWQLDIAKDW